MTAFGDPATQLAFSMNESRGVFALLLGSGLSRAAEIPTGWEITLDLVRRVALVQGEQEQDDWAAWYFEKEGKEPDYSALLAQLASTPRPSAAPFCIAISNRMRKTAKKDGRCPPLGTRQSQTWYGVGMSG